MDYSKDLFKDPTWDKAIQMVMAEIYVLSGNEKFLIHERDFRDSHIETLLKEDEITKLIVDLEGAGFKTKSLLINTLTPRDLAEYCYHYASVSKNSEKEDTIVRPMFEIISEPPQHEDITPDIWGGWTSNADESIPEFINGYPNPMYCAHEIDEYGDGIMKEKNHDYTGGSGDPYANFRDSEGLGVHPVIGVMIRMRDKMQRVRTYVEKGKLKVKGESIMDALGDIRNYNALIYGLIKEEQNAESETPLPEGEGSERQA